MMRHIKVKVYIFIINFIFLSSILYGFQRIQENDTVSSWNLFSPNQTIEVGVKYDIEVERQLTYQITLKSKDHDFHLIEPSTMGLIRDDETFIHDLDFRDFEKTVISEQYKSIAGKRKMNVVNANEYTFKFTNSENSEIEIIFRIFNDGVAFKYNFPARDKSLYMIREEHTSFNFPESGIAWMLPYDSVGVWSPAYEAVYKREIPVGTPAPSSTGWGFPSLFNVNNCWILLTEAGLNATYCGSHLAPVSKGGEYRIMFPLETESYGLGSRYPHSSLPWATPWRVVVIGNDLKTIVESNIVNHLAEPCKLANTDWIEPGRCSWSWWGDHSSARNYNILKSYVDLSAKMGWEYSLVDAEWDYMTGGSLSELAEYANSKNVGLFVWYNSGGPHNKAKAMYRITDTILKEIKAANYFTSDEFAAFANMKDRYYFDDEPFYKDIENLIDREISNEIKLDILKRAYNPNATPRDRMHIKDIRRDEFKKLHEMGVKGVKIDFFNSDKQNIIDLYLGIAEDAADYNILVNTHGCTIPRGWQRTWPNYLSMEGVRGAELYGAKSFPERAVWLNTLYPFTRNVIGPMDYTPVTFSDYSPETAHITTNAHELALSVIFECGVQHFADRKESYEAQPHFIKSYLSNIPVTWDEIYFIDGYPGKEIILARRKSDIFYVAGINGEMKGKTFNFKLPFLENRTYDFSLITDYDKPRKWNTESKQINGLDEFKISVLPAGGFVGIITRAKQ